MLFRIRHTTRYTYAQPVALGPTLVRLRPRMEPTQRVRAFQLRVSPDADGQNECLDLEGNVTSCVRFTGRHDFLSITTFAEVETLARNPFDFLIAASSGPNLPLAYDSPDSLQPYLRRAEPSEAVDRLAEQVRDQSGGEVVPFLSALCQRIASDIVYMTRDHGSAWSPAKTLQQGRGACRDTALLFLDACRAQGIAARFVSGYAQGFRHLAASDLHAWAEVYLPGGGWRGFDPSLGTATVERHVAVAAGATADLAAPVSGTFLGRPGEATLWYDISVESLKSDSPQAQEPP